MSESVSEPAPALTFGAEAAFDAALAEASVVKVKAQRQTDAKHHVALRIGDVLLFDDSFNVKNRRDRERFLDAATKHDAKLAQHRDAIAQELVRIANEPEHETASNGPPPQGGALLYETDASWPEPVDGALLLALILAELRRYVILPPHADVACALWVVHTFALDFIAYTPRLAFLSAEKRSGKSRALRVVGAMVRRAQPAENCTPAVLFRLIEAQQPTLLLDEADAWLVGQHANEELRGILNAGFEPTGQVLRCEGELHEPRGFRVFAACAVAMIGRPPATIEDRSIVVQMRRALPDQKVARLDIRAVREKAAGVRQRCVRFVADHADDLRSADPDIPASLDDRAADCWRPLIAIADQAGGEWPELARKAALALSGGRDADDSSRGTMLLHDIRAVFVERGVDRIGSDDLVKTLRAMEGRPWAEWRHGQPITSNRVASLLKPYGVNPTTLRLPGGERLKGYALAEFADAFARYLSALPSPPVLNRDNVTNSQTKPSSAFRGENVTVTPSHDVTVEIARQALGVCVTGTDRKS